MALNEWDIIQMTASDFEPYKFRKLKVFTKQEMEINGVKGTEFIGFISGLYLAANPPNLPGSIKFIDESISPTINRRISDDFAKSIPVFQIERIETL